MAGLPSTIGRFTIESRIAQGGMGAVYLAWDPMLERQIVLKLLRDDSEGLRERFTREAKAVARLHHPHIVTIFDVGEDHGQPFIAMEYVEGPTLFDVIRARTPLPIDRRLELVEQLCDGLAFAHRAGIVHRDIKPANLMVDREGMLKVLDFGIARVGPAATTHAGTLVGTLNYMSPEQVMGQALDHRSDIFAVGGVFYELLSYRQAFPGGLDSGILNRILHQPPEPLATICQGLDPDIVRVVEKAMEKDPAKRYQDLPPMRREVHRIRLRYASSNTQIDVDTNAPTIKGPAEAPRPTPTPRTPRRERDLEVLRERRRAQIDQHLQTARGAMAAGDFAAAVAACEEALLLDSDDQASNDLLDEAKAALDAFGDGAEPTGTVAQAEATRARPSALPTQPVAPDPDDFSLWIRPAPAKPVATPAVPLPAPVAAATPTPAPAPASAPASALAAGAEAHDLLGPAPLPFEEPVRRQTLSGTTDGWRAVDVSQGLRVLTADGTRPMWQVYAAAGAAATALLLLTLAVWPRRSAEPAPGAATPTASAQTVVPPSPTPPATATPRDETPAPLPAPPSPPSATITEAAPTSAGSAPSAEIAALRNRARQQIRADDLDGALITVLAGLKQQPKDRDLGQRLDELFGRSRVTAERARDRALSAGPEVVGSDEYKRALNKEQEALALATTDPGEAVKGLRDATNLYTRATESVQTIITRRSEADAAAAKDGPRSDEDLVRA
ncbi:MAG: serine/threonine-protein kinase, partial [Vicinamibacterales bacterium]